MSLVFLKFDYFLKRIGRDVSNKYDEVMEKSINELIFK